MPRIRKKLLPVVSERRPGLGAAFVVSVLLAVFRAHIVEGQGDGGFAGPEVVIGRGLPRTRLGAGCSTIQARARSDCCEPVSAKASVPRTVGVTPLPAGVLTGADVFDVTRRRQGRRDGLAGSWDGHGDSWARLGCTVVVWQCVAMGLIYPNARGTARRRHGRTTGSGVVRGPATYWQLKRASQHTSAARVANAAE
jgi:hypothetical protein